MLRLNNRTTKQSGRIVNGLHLYASAAACIVDYSARSTYKQDILLAFLSFGKSSTFRIL